LVTAADSTAELAVCWQRDFGEVNADAEAAPWSELARLALVENSTGALPQQGTRLQLGWTPDELRVLFHCADTHPWATLTARDAPLYEEEVVEVFLDPVGDSAAYFELEVNPLNAVLDLALRRNRSGYLRDFSWRCDALRTAVHVTDSSWTAEFAIPFRSLAAEPPQPLDRWRGNFFRIDRPAGAPRELSAWSPTRRGTFHVPQRFGFIEFRT
jgi:hypothetical protein